MNQLWTGITNLTTVYQKHTVLTWNPICDDGCVVLSRMMGLDSNSGDLDGADLIISLILVNLTK